MHKASALTFRLGGCFCGFYRVETVDDINPASPIIWNIPYIPSFPEFTVLKVMQDLYHQQKGLLKSERL